MDAGIHFLAQDLLGALDGQRSHLLAQGFTGLDCLLLGLGAGSSNNLVAFFGGTGLGFFDDGLGTAFGVRKPRCRFVARLGQFLLDALVGGGQVSLGLRSEEHTSELQSPCNLVCRLLLEKKKITLCSAPFSSTKKRSAGAGCILSSGGSTRRSFPPHRSPAPLARDSVPVNPITASSPCTC